MNNWLYNNILTSGLAFAIVGIIIPQILNIAFRKNLFDSHDERKVHTGNVPRLGGIAFVPGIMFALMLTLGMGVQMAETEMQMALHQGFVPICFLSCSLMLLFLVGIADDLVGVRYTAKFVFQIICGVLTIASGMAVTNLHGVLWLNVIPEWMGWPLTVLFIVYLINSLNLIDGIDGLAAGLATLTLGYFGIAYYDAGEYILSMIAFGGVGALIPFLYFNIFGKANNQSKIFMGDTGSLTIGMVIAYLAVGFTNAHENDNLFANINPMVVAFSPLMIPIFDQLRVFYHRIIRHRNPFMPDKCHIHHKLLMLGLNKKQVLVVILSVALVLIVANWFMSRYLNVNLVFLIDFAIWLMANILLTKGIRKKERSLGEHLYD